MSANNDLLSLQVADAMTERIIENEYQAGHFLPSERDLQQQYQVSRTVIREAMKMLVARGLVATSARHGTLVNVDLTGPLTETMLRAFYRSDVYVEDVLGTRLMLEPQIVRLAAQHATSVQVRELLALAAEFESIPIGSDQPNYEALRQRWLENDQRFHILLAEATQNPILPILIDVVVGHIWHSAQLIQRSISVEHHALVIQHHAQIAVRVAAKDAEGAAAAMLEHLEYTRRYLPILRKRLRDISEI